MSTIQESTQTRRYSILSVYHHWDGYPEWLGVTQTNSTIQERKLLNQLMLMFHLAILTMSTTMRNKSLSNDPRPEYYADREKIEDVCLKLYKMTKSILLHR